MLITCISLTTFGQVGINSDGTPPDGSAMLDVKSAVKGLLAPRVNLSAINSADPISNPAIGLLVFNTTAAGIAPNNVAVGYYFWNGTRWIPTSSFLGSNVGDMQYWDGTQWVRVPVGVNGQVLTLNNGIPTWGGNQLPIVSTTAITSITAGSAISGGYVSSDGSATVTARGVCWNILPNPTTINSKTINGSGAGVFTSNVTGLAPGTVYHLRAYATNSLGTAYGNELSLTTGCSGFPTVSVTISPSANPICAGTAVTFTATAINGGTAPAFLWKVNGINTGTNSNAYTYVPVNNDVVTCVVTANTLCVTGNPATSNAVTMTVNPVPSSPASGIHIASQNQIEWQWNSVEGATGYKWSLTNDYGTAIEMGTDTIKTENGLTCNSNYLRYIWAYNFCGHSIMTSITKSTLSCTVLSTVTTTPVTNISQTNATSGGVVISDGGGTVTERGVCWSTTPNPTTMNSKTIDGSGTGSFISSISGFSPGTVYYVRAYSVNEAGTAYGNELFFAYNYATIGTGTASSDYPYSTYWMGGRTQTLFTAAELTAAGVTAGNLSSIGFDVISNSTQLMNGFTIKMGLTTATTLTGTYATSPTTIVYSTAYAVPGTGWQDITLTTPFAWNGTSNLLIDICYGNTQYSTDSPVKATAAAGMTTGYYADVQTACSQFTGTAQANRPNTRFGLQPVSPNLPVRVSITP